MSCLQLDIISFQEPLSQKSIIRIQIRNKEYLRSRDIVTLLTLNLYTDSVRRQIRKGKSTNQNTNRKGSYKQTAPVRQILTLPSQIDRLELQEEITYLRKSLKNIRNRNAFFRKRKGSQPYLEINRRITEYNFSPEKILYRGYFTRYPKKSSKSNENS